MPRFRCIVECKGIETRRDNLGFFTTRTVRARSLDQARAEALKQVERSWTYDSMNGRPGAAPGTAAIVEAWQLSWFDYRRLPNKGSSFYDDSVEARESALRIERGAARVPSRLHVRSGMTREGGLVP
jgi:hypothetical protein